MSNSLKDVGLSSEELKAIAEIRDIKGYKSMSKGELLSANEFNEPRYKFSKLKIKEIRKNLYEIENGKTPPNQK